MKICTQEDYADAVASDPGYCHWGRWAYYEAAASMIGGIDDTAIELGPHTCPLVRDGVCLDCHSSPASPRPMVVCDLDRDPIPFARDSFSVCVALQLLEHVLDPAKTLAEMLEVAPVAVVSLPWNWQTGDETHTRCGESWWDGVIGDSGRVLSSVIVNVNCAKPTRVFKLERNR